MNTDVNRTTRAKEWLAGAENKWRLQTLQTRGRFDPKTGKYKVLPTRLRRFLNGTPVGVIHETLELLKSQAPYSDPVYCTDASNGNLYRPTSTYIQKDGMANASGGKDATYTIIQDLRLMDDAEDLLDFEAQNSCSVDVDSSYIWDATGVDALPEGEQGVVWAIDGLSRDSETDLLSYRLVKTTAITQHVMPYVARSNGRETTTVETWDNVYGTPEKDLRYDTVKGNGEPIELPSSDDGVTVEVAIQENPDCTYKIQVTKTTAVEQGKSYSIYKDQYKSNWTETTLNSEKGLDKNGVVAKDGVITKYSSQLNPDGTFNNETSVETEFSVSESTYEMRVTPKGTVTSTTNTNQATAPSRSITGYGSLKITKTPGNRYTWETSSFTRPTTSVDISETCSKTYFAHTHESEESVPGIPDKVDADSAKNGTVKTFGYRVDDMGAVTKTERSVSEIKVTGARKSVEIGLHGTVTQTTDRSVSVDAAKLILDKYTNNWKYENIGCSASYEITDGGLANLTEQIMIRAKNVQTAIAKKATIYETVEETTVATDEMGNDDATASGGKLTAVRYAMDARGEISKTTTETQETNVDGAEKEVRETRKATVTTTKNRNVKTAPSTTNLPDGASVSYRKTDGGLYDETRTAVSAKDALISTSKETTILRTTDSSTHSGNGAAAQDTTAEAGKIKRTTTAYDDSGIKTVSNETMVFSHVNEGYVSRNIGGVKETTTIHRNKTSPDGVSGSGSASFSINENGTYDGQVTTFEFEGKSDTIVTDNKALRKETTTIYKNEESPKDAGDNGGANASINEYGAFNGSYSEVTYTEGSETYDSMSSALVTRSTTIYRNSTAPKKASVKEGTASTASASMDNDKLFHGEVTVETPTPIERAYGPYTSTEVGPFGNNGTITTKRTVKGIVFCNYKEIPKVDTGNIAGLISVSTGISINKYGLLDGKVELTITSKEWNSGGGGGGGGSIGGTSSSFTTTTVNYTPINFDKTSNTVSLLRVTTTRTNQIGRKCNSVPGTMYEGSSVSANADGTFNYHAITSIDVHHDLQKVVLS